jgi:hypothetical protein
LNQTQDTITAKTNVYPSNSRFSAYSAYTNSLLGATISPTASKNTSAIHNTHTLFPSHFNCDPLPETECDPNSKDPNVFVKRREKQAANQFNFSGDVRDVCRAAKRNSGSGSNSNCNSNDNSLLNNTAPVGFSHNQRRGAYCVDSASNVLKINPYFNDFNDMDAFNNLAEKLEKISDIEEVDDTQYSSEDFGKQTKTYSKKSIGNIKKLNQMTKMQMNELEIQNGKRKAKSSLGKKGCHVEGRGKGEFPEYEYYDCNNECDNILDFNQVKLFKPNFLFNYYKQS